MPMNLAIQLEKVEVAFRARAKVKRHLSTIVLMYRMYHERLFSVFLFVIQIILICSNENRVYIYRMTVIKVISILSPLSGGACKGRRTGKGDANTPLNMISRLDFQICSNSTRKGAVDNLRVLINERVSILISSVPSRNLLFQKT